jgi:hypothetical protein
MADLLDLVEYIQHLSEGRRPNIRDIAENKPDTLNFDAKIYLKPQSPEKEIMA